MVFVIKNDETVKITRVPPIEGENLVMTLNTESPYRRWLIQDDIYKPGILRILPKVIQDIRLDKGEGERILSEIKESLVVLGISTFSPTEVPDSCPLEWMEQVKGVVDGWLGDDYDLTDRIIRFISLPKKTKEWIKNLPTLPRDRQIQELSESPESYLEEVYEYLPSIFRELLRLDLSESSPVIAIPEFLNRDLIQPTPDLPRLIYSEFKLGEDLGGDEIVSRLERLYQKSGINKKAMIKDLYEFFNIVPSRSRTNGTRGYRIDTRKIL